MVGSLGELQNVRCCFASDLRSERSGLNEKHQGMKDCKKMFKSDYFVKKSSFWFLIVSWF